MSMQRWIVAIFLSIALVSGAALADKPEKKSAILVEFHYLPKCAGLDCPPWHIPPDIDFCFQVGDTLYVGSPRPWGVPWATNAEGLTAFKGKSVEIVVTEKAIRVTTSNLNLRLRRFHRVPGFEFPGCGQA
jgi:hypothetical protein